MEYRLIERNIYGSAQVGICKDTVDLNITNAAGALTQATYYHARQLNHRQYSLSNHLGNVLTTIGDGKAATDSNSDGVIDYFTAYIISVSDYSPFGVELAGRTWSIEEYRNGFNGKEKVTEITGNSSDYDFGARIYDARIGRWLSVDPLTSKTPSYSTYNYCFNNCITYIDPDGKEPILPYVGTAAMLRSLLNNSPRGVGNYTGELAALYVRNAGNNEWSWRQLRPLPTENYLSKKEGRYIYTEKGGWIDMLHFMFYAGKAYDYKIQKEEANKVIEKFEFKFMPFELQFVMTRMANMSPVGEAVQDGYFQEFSDKYSASNSAYSYEDLPSDKFGADFGANYFDPKSKFTLGEQLQNYLNDLGATEPKNAPNYYSLPKTDPVDSPTRKNYTTKPLFTKENP
jgi:RHS repeat-associated protein